MPFVTRNEDENIIGLASTKQYPDQEYLPENNAGVKIFRGRRTKDPNEERIQDEIRKLAIDSLKLKGKYV